MRAPLKPRQYHPSKTDHGPQSPNLMTGMSRTTHDVTQQDGGDRKDRLSPTVTGNTISANAGRPGQIKRASQALISLRTTPTKHSRFPPRHHARPRGRDTTNPGHAGRSPDAVPAPAGGTAASLGGVSSGGGDNGTAPVDVESTGAVLCSGQSTGAVHLPPAIARGRGTMRGFCHMPVGSAVGTPLPFSVSVSHSTSG